MKDICKYHLQSDGVFFLGKNGMNFIPSFSLWGILIPFQDMKLTGLIVVYCPLHFVVTAVHIVLSTPIGMAKVYYL